MKRSLLYPAIRVDGKPAAHPFTATFENHVFEPYIYFPADHLAEMTMRELVQLRVIELVLLELLAAPDVQRIENYFTLYLDHYNKATGDGENSNAPLYDLAGTPVFKF